MIKRTENFRGGGLSSEVGISNQRWGSGDPPGIPPNLTTVSKYSPVDRDMHLICWFVCSKVLELEKHSKHLSHRRCSGIYALFIVGVSQLHTTNTNFIPPARWTNADLGFYKGGGCPIHLKGAPEVERRGGCGMGRGLCPSAENVCMSYTNWWVFMHSRWYLLTL